MNAKEAVFESFSKKHQQFGPIRLRQYDDLLGGEVEEYERQSRQQAAALMELNEIAKVIGAHPDSGLTADQAFLLLTSEDQEAVKIETKVALCLQFGPPGGMAAVTALVPNAAEQHTRMITMALNSRGSVRLDEDWRPLADEAWTDDDSRALPQRLRTQIIDFMAAEGNGGKKAGKHKKAAEHPAAEAPPEEARASTAESQP
jgi:hypothetical protein